jgi:hypothetical protein
MRLLFYAPVSEGAGERLQKVIKESVPKNKVNVEVYRNIENLSRRLRQPAEDLPIAVLLAARREDLLDILSVRDLLCDVRIILILPDRDENTISLGHTLRPRFLSYTDSDFADVFAVLEKCLESYAIKV